MPIQNPVMAQCPLPVDVPLSPPPYEEAILTTAPEIPVVVETESNDEPPPSYSEATKDDVFPSQYSEQSNTNDLTELILASIISADRPRQGRQPLISHQLQTSDACPSDPEQTREVETRNFQARSRHRKKLSICFLAAGTGVFLVAALIAASILRHKPKISGPSSSDQAFMKSVTIPSVDPAIRKVIWTNTLRPYDMPKSYLFEHYKKQRKEQSLFDALMKAMKDANGDQAFFFHVKHNGRDSSALGRSTSTKDPFYAEINKIKNNQISTEDPFYEEIRRLHNMEQIKTTSTIQTDKIQ